MSYPKHNFQPDAKLTAAALNEMDNQIAANETAATSALEKATTVEEAAQRGDFDGAPGADGKSAYQTAVEGGFIGTAEEFAEKLAAPYPEEVFWATYGTTDAETIHAKMRTAKLVLCAYNDLVYTAYLKSVDGGPSIVGYQVFFKTADAENSLIATTSHNYQNGSVSTTWTASETTLVQSVNGKTGAVTLDASDVGALPSDTGLDDIPDGTTYSRTTAAQVAQIGTNATAISGIEGKIPAAASSSNKLMDAAAVDAAIAEALSGITGIDFEVVQSLPASGEARTIYLVPHGGSEATDIYDEYVWLSSGRWELLGTTAVDLTGYATQAWVQQQGYLTSVPNTYRTASAQDVIDDAQDAAIAAKYSKPSGGIPENDLSVDVRALLNGGISSALKAALLQFAQKASYIDGSGPNVYTALYNALNSTVTLVSISAALAQGTTIYEYNTLDDVAAALTVTATYSDSSTATVTGWTLSGTLAIGSDTLTVSYQGKTTTVSVTVLSALPSGYTRLTYVEANGQQYIDTGVKETEVGWADYEILVTQATDKGGHIFSHTNIFMPAPKGTGKNTLLGKNRGNETPSSGTTDFSWDTNVWYHFQAFLPEIKIDGVTQCTIPSGNRDNQQYSMYLFTWGASPSSTSYRFYGKLKDGMRVYDTQNALSHYFITCKNGSNVVGIYDPFTETFMSSGSATALIAGEVVA